MQTVAKVAAQLLWLAKQAGNTIEQSKKEIRSQEIEACKNVSPSLDFFPWQLKFRIYAEGLGKIPAILFYDLRLIDLASGL